MLFCGTAYSNSAYLKYVKPMEQKTIDNPYKVNGNPRRLEGCGPIASSMLMGFWETEKNYTIMHSGDNFNGMNHPYKTIKRNYKESGARKSPGSRQSYTLPDKLVKGLKTSVARANRKVTGNKKKLAVSRAKAAPFRKWSYRLSKLKQSLNKGYPVILLIHNIPGCLNGKDSKTGGWHYVVANGYKDSTKEIFILSGWDELAKTQTSGFSVHSGNGTTDTRVKCSFSEIKKANPALFWIRKK